MRGRFITFEGGEGCGKSTQLRLLAESLQNKGLEIVTTKEPGGTPTGQELRRILVTGDKNKLDPVAEALLYYADRRINMTQKVWPALDGGNWVLSDRFADSTVAYQYYGYNRQLAQEDLDRLYHLAVGDFRPDLTLILDIEPEKGLARSYHKAQSMEVKELRFEKKNLEFHKNLRNGFLKIAAAEPERCVVLNADKSIEALHREILSLVTKRFEV